MDAIIILHELNHCFHSAKRLLFEASSVGLSLVEQEVMLEMADYYIDSAKDFLLKLNDLGYVVNLTNKGDYEIVAYVG